MNKHLAIQLKLKLTKDISGHSTDLSQADNSKVHHAEL